MDADEDYQDYLLELREHVCSHCVERQPDCPPCTPHGKACGIELHLPELVSICRTTDDVQMDTYIQQLHDKICLTCEDRDKPTCPCPLEYLLKIAVEAVERVERRRADQGSI